MQLKILIVDHEPDILEFLDSSLTREGFKVLRASTSEEALKKIFENPDLIVLELQLPKMDGFEVSKKIRSTSGFERIPIVLLTAKSDESVEILGLETGASDFIKKPVSAKKFVARIKSNLRNVTNKYPEEILPAKIFAGPLEIDRDKYRVLIDGKEKVFPKKEFEILFHLASNPSYVFNRESLLRTIWGNDVYVVERTIDVHIRKIRQKLGKHSGLIETLKGVGYRFKKIK
ncbi:MAG TPA: response regulator transcription factor [Ignavibacteriaceae bacterium]|nr:response regulator transcription factor [Ignavibacteriaceae bacterium]